MSTAVKEYQRWTCFAAGRWEFRRIVGLGTGCLQRTCLAAGRLLKAAELNIFVEVCNGYLAFKRVQREGDFW